MCDRKTFTIDGREIVFINDTAATRSGFKHVTTMYYENCSYNSITNTVYYLNRTWESYRYQTVMTGAARLLRDYYRGQVREEYMLVNNYKRLTAARREQLEHLQQQDPRVLFAQKIIDEVKTARFYW